MLPLARSRPPPGTDVFVFNGAEDPTFPPSSFDPGTTAHLFLTDADIIATIPGGNAGDDDDDDSMMAMVSAA